MKRHASDSLLEGRADKMHEENPSAFPRIINELLDLLVEIHLAGQGDGPIHLNRENQE